jgi:hypothetical protein
MSLQQIERIPQNQTTSSINQLIAALEITDPRYNLSSLGGFLRELPMRIGKNQALDAAVDSLNSSFSALCSGQCSTEMYTKYGHALRAMRRGMDQIEPNSLFDVMAAIHLLLLSEVRNVQFRARHVRRLTNIRVGCGFITFQARTVSPWRISFT